MTKRKNDRRLWLLDVAMNISRTMFPVVTNNCVVDGPVGAKSAKIIFVKIKEIQKILTARQITLINK